jgi:hypothetical protein
MQSRNLPRGAGYGSNTGVTCLGRGGSTRSITGVRFDGGGGGYPRIVGIEKGLSKTRHQLRRRRSVEGSVYIYRHRSARRPPPQSENG